MLANGYLIQLRIVAAEKLQATGLPGIVFSLVLMHGDEAGE